MQPFLKYLAQHIFENYADNTENLCIILPNKRGALYLKQHLAEAFQKTIWLPTILSAEDLVANLSELHDLDNIDLICELYSAYCEVLKDKAESFDSFAKWGNLMLQDFNEADRYLVNTDTLYLDLKNIKEIENWSLNANELTPTQQDYINFMAHMGTIYHVFTKNLLAKNAAYQGLMYRKAFEKYPHSSYLNKFSNIVIAGFNALNKVESHLFSDLAKNKKATIIWDGDLYYLKNESYEAGLFLRKNFTNQWLNTKTLIGNYFSEIPKNIEIIAAPKQIGQAQAASNQLKKWIKEGKSLNKTAIILADESLLFPVLNQIPNEIDAINVTMEYPLRLSPIYNLVENLISLHLSVENSKTSQKFYFADLFKIFQNTIFKKYIQLISPNINLQRITQTIIDKNYVWIDTDTMQLLFEEEFNYIQPLFTPWRNSKKGISSITHILSILNQTDSTQLKLPTTENEYLHLFTKYFNRLHILITQHDYLDALSTFKSLYKQIIGTATVPFIGEPLQGLQIMGVLETRTLDFENIIILGVNEGVLPSGKSVNSFIPNDLKRHNNMPLYADKDAIYAYHFYRILQRASNILITYNTEQSAFGGNEKSRFITQLQFELQKYNPSHRINERMLNGDELVASTINKIEVSKTENSLESIIAKLTTNNDYGGLSPSALITYKDCPLKFFFRYGEGLKETEDVEEIAEYNTQGSILHLSLEKLYTPFIGKILYRDDLNQCLNRIETTVSNCFLEYFSQKESRFGKNYLQQKVLQQYVKKQVIRDIEIVEQTNSNNEYLSIIALEKKLEASLVIEYQGEPLTIYIKGSSDRIDRLGSKVRIIDYKSSVKTTDKFQFDTFENLFSNSQYNKMLQLFIYAWLAVKNNIAKPEELMPCIIPFKHYLKEPKSIQSIDKKSGSLIFSIDLLQEFEEHLKNTISLILSNQNKFSQTENRDVCKFCSYAPICNIKV